MIRASIGFFLIGIVAYVFGLYGVAGLSVEIGRTLLFIFLALVAISLIGSLLMGSKATKRLP